MQHRIVYTACLCTYNNTLMAKIPPHRSALVCRRKVRSPARFVASTTSTVSPPTSDSDVAVARI